MFSVFLGGVIFLREKYAKENTHYTIIPHRNTKSHRIIIYNQIKYITQL